jgi:uncharacterized protein YegJ (DUF2314 family)
MGETIIGVLFVGAVVVAFLAYQRSRAATAPPVPISTDDPAMAAARAEARATIGEFRQLYASHREASQVKVPVTSSSGVLELMVGDVIDLTEFNVTVQLRGRPATHNGPFQPVQVFPLGEIADWLVVTPNGKYRGGFTHRVHVDRMRKAGTLVGAAEDEASKFE